MEAKTFTVINPGNSVTSGNQVFFYVAGTNQTTLTNVYATNVQANPLQQPILTDSNGQVHVFSPNGSVDVKLVQTSGLVEIIKDTLFDDPVDDTHQLTSVVNEGSGVGVFDKIVGNAINLKSLKAGPNINLTDVGNGQITISASGIGTGTVQGGASEGTGITVFDAATSTSATLKFKSLTAGSHATIVDDGNGNLTINGTGTVQTGSSEGTGHPVFDAANSTSTNLTFKSVAGGPNIQIADNGDGRLIFTAIGAGTGTVIGGLNEGGGADVFDSVNSTSSYLAFKTLGGGANISVVDNGLGELIISSTAPGTGTVTSGASEGSGVAVFDASTSTAATLKFKSLVAGANTTVTDNGSGGLVLSSSNPGGTVTSGASEGAGIAVFDSGSSTSATLKFKSLVQGGNVTLTDNGTSVTVAASTSGGTVTGATSDGTGHPVYNAATTTSSNLHFKSLTAGSNVTVTDDGAGNLTIAASTSSGTVTGGASEGAGIAVFDSSSSTSSTLKFKSLVQGSNVTLTDNGTSVTVAATNSGGTVTSGASEGAGVAVFDASSSTSATLKFKSLVAGTNVTLTDNGTSITVASSGSSQPTVRHVTSGSTDTLLSTDNQNTVRYESTTATIVTIPNNATLSGLTEGFSVDWALAIGGGQLTFSVQSGDLLEFFSPSAASTAQSVGAGCTGTIRLVKVSGSARTWVVSGGLT